VGIGGAGIDGDVIGGVSNDSPEPLEEEEDREAAARVTKKTKAPVAQRAATQHAMATNEPHAAVFLLLAGAFEGCPLVLIGLLLVWTRRPPV
jgi:hypothetical protein